MALTYTSYLKLDALLQLQSPLSAGPEHDEMLFITIHQAYELWFKQILHELDWLQRALGLGELPLASATFKRVLTILKTLVAQVDILETMTPLSFNSFRDRLEAASGFQSAQFRALELRLGRRDGRWEHIHPDGSPERALIVEARAQPSVYSAFLNLLSRRGFAIPPGTLLNDPEASNAEDPAIRAVLIEVYRHHPDLSQVCERFVDLDEGLQEWRYRHAKMVERTIGSKQGTGGSPGATYLRNTLFKPLFPDLWTIRNDF